MTAIQMLSNEQFQILKNHKQLQPGMAWYCPWFHDPESPDDGFKPEHGYLSRFYWETWADKRPPIVVICPNGEHWCIDSKSSNGEGWQITGQPPVITASPSIQVPGYHGFLQNGVFTSNL